jgi:hypothetical protein
MIDERLARRYWPGIDPVGRRFGTPEDTKDSPRSPARRGAGLTIGVVGE